MADPQVIFFKGIVKVRGKSWFYFQIPNKVLGTKKRIYLKGKLNSQPCYILANYSDNDRHEVALSKAMQSRYGLKNLKAGDTVYLYITELTDIPPPLQIPEALQVLLNSNRQASEAWENLSRTKQTEILRWISTAKQTDTRSKRIHMLLDALIRYSYL